MFISSDTNIWFDFEETGNLEHPFLLDNDYYLSDVTYHDEIQTSHIIHDIVERGKLQITSVLASEIQIAGEYAEQYPALSIHDAISLAIAKTRGWILLSGDGKLREAAAQESVECHGTLWIYKSLKEQGKLTNQEYRAALEKLLDAVKQKGRRLPKNEIIRMLNECKTEKRENK